MDGTGLTEGEKEEGAKTKQALNSDGEGSEDEGDTRKAATYGTKKTEVVTLLAMLSSLPTASGWRQCCCNSPAYHHLSMVHRHVIHINIITYVVKHISYMLLQLVPAG